MRTSALVARLSWTVALLQLAPALALAAPPGPVTSATSAEDLEGARQLFTDALRDEEAQRYQVALEKFQRVQRVRDTAPVRYRIATCLEGLGRLVEARAAYAAAAEQASGDEAQSKLGRAARERAAALALRVAYLTVRLEPGRDDAVVRVDGEEVPASRVTADEGLPLDPGRHKVAALAPGAMPFEGEVSLPEGGRVTLRIPLVAPPPASAGSAAPPASAPPAEAPARSLVGPWLAVGAGGAAVVAGVVALAVREADAVALQAACPGGLCPEERRDELESQRARAELLGPLGAVLLGAGVLAAGTGAYFLLRSPDGKASVGVTPVAGPHGAGIHWRGVF